MINIQYGVKGIHKVIDGKKILFIDRDIYEYEDNSDVLKHVLFDENGSILSCNSIFTGDKKYKIDDNVNLEDYYDTSDLIYKVFEDYGYDCVYLNGNVIDEYTGEIEDEALRAIVDVGAVLLLPEYTHNRDSGTYEINISTTDKSKRDIYYYRDIHNILHNSKYANIINCNMQLKSVEEAKEFVRDRYNLDKAIGDVDSRRFNIKFEETVFNKISVSGGLSEKEVSDIFNKMRK